MKLLIASVLILGSIAQLCSALDDITQDKRYVIFNLIASKANEYKTNEYLEYGAMHIDQWPEFSKTISADKQNSENFQEFEKQMQQTIESVRDLENDKHNCDLIKALINNLETLYEMETAGEWEEFAMVQKAEEEITKNDKHNVISTLYNIFAELPSTIESFQQSINEQQKKEEFKEIFETCEEFLKAQDDFEKYSSLSSIVTLLRNDKTFAVEECRFKAIEDFDLKLVIYLF